MAKEREPFYTTLPGVDLSGVPAAKLPALLKDLNARRCPYECLRYCGRKLPPADSRKQSTRGDLSPLVNFLSHPEGSSL